MTQEPGASIIPTISSTSRLLLHPSTFLMVFEFLKAWEELLTKRAISTRNCIKGTNSVFLHVVDSKISFYKFLRYEVLWTGHSNGQHLESWWLTDCRLLDHSFHSLSTGTGSIPWLDFGCPHPYPCRSSACSALTYYTSGPTQHCK